MCVSHHEQAMVECQQAAFVLQYWVAAGHWLQTPSCSDSEAQEAEDFHWSISLIQEGLLVEEGLVRFVSLLEVLLEGYPSTELGFRYKVAATEWKLLTLRGNTVAHPGLHNPPQLSPPLVQEEALEDAG